MLHRVALVRTDVSEELKPGVPLRPIESTIGSITYRLAQHLVRLLSGHTGHSPHHLKNSIEFVQFLGSLQVDTNDIMVRFDIVSLFTKVPIRETIGLLGRHFEEDVLGIFRHVLPLPTSPSMDSSTGKQMMWPWVHRFLLS
jgi:hypothetical protein